MTKFEEAIALYTSFMSDKLKMTDIDASVLVALAEMLGPNIYDADASLVACSDKSELKRVKELFLIRELKLADSAELDGAIKTVCGKMGASNRKKYRVVFYYLLLQEFQLTHLYSAKKVEKTVVKTTAAKATKTTKTTVSAKSAAAAETVTLENAPVAAETLKLVITESMDFNEKVDAYKTLIVSYLNFPDMDYDLLANLTNTAGGNATVNVKSTSDRTNIKDNFLKGRLGLNGDTDLDEAIDLVNTRMGSTPKYRPVFYYLLTKHLGKEWVIMAPSEGSLF